MKETLVKFLAEKVTPYLQMHGGDVEFVDVVDNCVSIRLKGACQDCSAAQITVETVIKEAIVSRFLEIEKVMIEPSDDSLELIKIARDILSGGTGGIINNHKD